MSLNLFIPITKVDAAKRLVHGIIAEEVPDKSGEIFDYASSKPNFERWSAEIAKASDGKSVGNLRAMHGKVAAGKLAALNFDDDGQRIEAVAKVVDEAEWAKVLEGVYTGFSIGGRYAKRWKDTAQPELVRYTAEPMEVSLVDNPCIPTATFAMVKADGSVERRRFRASGGPDARPAERPATAGASEVEQVWKASDGMTFRSKTDALRHNAELAAGALTGPLDQAVAGLKAAVEARAGTTAGSGTLRKDLGLVARLAALLDQLADLQQDAAEEALREGDGSDLPDRVEAWLGEGLALLRRMTEEEGAEPDAPDQLSDQSDGLEQGAGKRAGCGGRGAALGKRGARHSKVDWDRLNRAHDLLVELGAACGGADARNAAAGDDDDDRQAGKWMQAELVKLATENLALRRAVDEAMPVIAELRARVESLEAQPQPAKGVTRVVAISKEQDGGAPAGMGETLAEFEKRLTGLGAEARTHELMKLALRFPQTIQSR